MLPDWPPLAWVAHLDDGSNLRVIAGPGVHRDPNGAFFCEAVWDGDFSRGDFDQTDLIFGSGARHRDAGWTFVGSSTTVDRLHRMRSGTTWLISNSLAALLSVSGARCTLDPSKAFAFFESVIGGLDRYRKRLPTDRDEIELTYHRNLQAVAAPSGPWRVTEIEKPLPKRDFGNFDAYRDFLSSAMRRLVDNAASPNRQTPFDPIATISTGYDSTASAAIAAEAGVRHTISVDLGRGEVEDDGSGIARMLGMIPNVVRRDRSLNSDETLPLFLASDAKGEDAYFGDAFETLRGKMLITGYSGSRVWDYSPSDYQGLRRGDQSGLSHTEARLHGGYLHVPVPFFAGTQESDIRALGRRDEMRRWQVGGDYDRPVCRRILETAGVPRDAFGQDKKAASVLWFDRRNRLPEATRQDLLAWRRSASSMQTDGLPKRHRDLWMLPRRFLRWLTGIERIRDWPLVNRLHREGRVMRFAQREPSFDDLFSWALQRTIERYPVDPSHLPAADPTPSHTKKV